MPAIAAAAALSTSTSGKTTSGFLPPSSRLTDLMPAACVIARPVGTLPVNAMRRTSGCATSAAPQVGPSPVTMFTTPAGKHSRTSFPIHSAESGVCSAGLRITVLPATSAGAIFPAAKEIG